MADPNAPYERREATFTVTEQDHMIESVQAVIEAARGAHYINVRIRKDGRDIVLEADWLKHLKPAEEPTP